MKRIWEKIKYTATSIFIFYAVIPIIIVVSYFWNTKKEMEDYGRFE